MVHGDVLDLSAVSETVAGCDVVVSALGPTRGSDRDVRRRGTANVIDAMRATGVRRLVVVGGFHVQFPGDGANIGRWLLLPILSLQRNLVSDTTAMGHVVRTSDMDWTLVRIPRVTSGGTSNDYRSGDLKLAPWHSATRGNIARFVLLCVPDSSWVGRAPIIAN